MRGGKGLAVAGAAAVFKDALSPLDTGVQSDLAGSDRRESHPPGDHPSHPRPWGKGCYVHLRSTERDSGPVPVHAEP